MKQKIKIKTAMNLHWKRSYVFARTIFYIDFPTHISILKLKFGKNLNSRLKI